MELNKLEIYKLFSQRELDYMLKVLASAKTPDEICQYMLWEIDLIERRGRAEKMK